MTGATKCAGPFPRRSPDGSHEDRVGFRAMHRRQGGAGAASMTGDTHMGSEVARHIRLLGFSKAPLLLSLAAVVLAAAALGALPARAASGGAGDFQAAPNDPHAAARALAESTGKAVPIGALTTEDSTTVANP